MQRRTNTIVIACLLAVVAALLPLVAMLTLARQQATAEEQAHLADYAGWALQRAETTLAEAERTLVALEAEGWDGCSPAHIARMRQLTVDEPAIVEIGYLRDGRLHCTSWGQVDGIVREFEPDAELPGGFALAIGVRPAVSRSGPVLIIAHRSHNVLVPQSRLVDVPINKEATLGVALRGGRLLAVTGPAPAAAAQAALRTNVRGDERSLHALRSGRDLTAFAVSDTAQIEGRRLASLGVLVPIGLVVSAILVGAILLVSRQRLSPRRELELAIQKRELIAHYQPIIDLSTGRCVGAEALARWRRPDDSLSMPDTFIPMAEQHHMISDLTDRIIEQVVADLAAILAAEPELHVAINISADDMHSGRFLPVLAAALNAAGVRPQQVWLEATERGFLHVETARATIEKARAAGHLIAIDDFGTGYSSLSLLEQLPLDALKIDRTFIAAIGKDAAKTIVTPHIIEIARSLGFGAIAEGVETAEQEAYVRAAGVRLAQGYRYAPALPADAFIAFFRNRNGDRAAALDAVA